jgi:hypothetical protein
MKIDIDTVDMEPRSRMSNRTRSMFRIVPAVSSRIHPFTLLSLFFVVVLLLVAGYQIELPGINYDEVLQMPAAIDLVTGQVNGSYHKFGSQRVFGLPLTLMNLEYIGAVKCYLFALSMGIFGIDVAVMRYTVLLLFVMGLAIFWHYAKEEYGDAAAAMTIVLVACDPGWIFLSRSDFGPIVIAFVARAMTLWLASRWWRSNGSAKYLIGAGFCAGLGFYDKVNFSWFILALLLAGITAYFISRPRPVLTPWTLLSTFLAGIAASFPFWIYNYHYNWPFLKKVNRELTLNDYLTLAPQRTKMLAGLINGEGPAWLFFTPEDLARFPGGTSLLGPLFLAALGIVLCAAIGQRQWRLLFLPAIVGFITIQILLTPTGIGLHHWTMLHPLPHLIVGVAVHLIWNRFFGLWPSRKRVGMAIMTAIFLVVATANLRVMIGYHQLLERTGGKILFSAAIYDLSNRLRQDYPDRPLQLMDWGLNHTLFFLSSGELYTREPFWELVGGRGDEKLIERLLENPRHVFVFNAPAGALYPEIYHQFHRVLEAQGSWQAHEIKILDRRSIWNYSIVEVERRGHEK